MRVVAMRKGALCRLELITRIPGHDSITAAARVLYDSRASALVQMLHKIETAAGFTIIDRTRTPLAPTDAGCEFIREAREILHAARQQVTSGSMPWRRETAMTKAQREFRNGDPAAPAPLEASYPPPVRQHLRHQSTCWSLARCCPYPPTGIRSYGKAVSTSGPSSVTTRMSSSRHPPKPGR